MAKFLITLSVVLAVCAVAVFGEIDTKKELADLMVKTHECQEDVNATDDDLSEMMAGKPASTMEGKCLRACIMQKYKVMDDEGKLDKSVLMNHAEKAVDGDEDKMKIANEIIEACCNLNVPHEDHCEAAVEYAECFKEQAEKHGLKEHFDM